MNDYLVIIFITSHADNFEKKAFPNNQFLRKSDFEINYGRILISCLFSEEKDVFSSDYSLRSLLYD